METVSKPIIFCNYGDLKFWKFWKFAYRYLLEERGITNKEMEMDMELSQNKIELDKWNKIKIWNKELKMKTCLRKVEQGNP